MDTNNNSKDLGDLESLIKMYKDGFLSDDEFKRAKAKFLGDSDTKEETENVTENLNQNEEDSSDKTQDNTVTESSKTETSSDTEILEKTASENNVNTEIPEKKKETEEKVTPDTEVKKKKSHKNLYWGIGIVAVLALSVCSYIAYLYPTKNELLCFLNQGDKCYAAGLDYQEGTDAIKKDESKALKYLEKGCELDNAESCLNLGIYFSEENRNLEKSFKYQKKACHLDNAGGCIFVGLMYFTGNGASLDLNKGNEYIDKSCKLSPSTCTKLAKNFLDLNEFPKDLKLTKFKKEDHALEYSLLEKACKYQDGEGCLGIGLISVSENLKKSIDWFSQGCDLNNDSSCYFLNVYFKYTNPPKAFEAAKKGCEKEGRLSCGSLADYYKKGIYIEKNIDKAISLYQKLCDSNVAPACTNLAELLENKHDKNNANNIIDILQKACDLEDGAGCIYLGFMHENGREVTKDKNKAQELYSKGNTLNANSCIFNHDPRACLFLGLSNKKGYGFDINNKLASTWYDKACSLNNDYACTFLGELYLYGKGVKKDKNKANNYFIKGCILGDPDGCAQANINLKK